LDTTTLTDKFKAHNATVAVVGLGYVGLPAALAFNRAGFGVIGLDIDAPKNEKLMRGESYLKQLPDESVRAAVDSGRFHATSDFAECAKADAILICVPTPLTAQREPDLQYVLATGKSIAAHLRAGQLVVLESTTYPGTTDDELRPILEARGLKAGKDFYLAYSPEREDPGNKDFALGAIPKVVGGYDPESLAVACALYEGVVKEVVPVSSTRSAEAAKLLENIFRSVNIALVNELKMAYDAMGLDIWEVIGAASTKPFGFMPFYPGPGLGGHCIPIDPFYLSWKAKEFGVTTEFIELAGRINRAMPEYVVGKLEAALTLRDTQLLDSKLLVLGVAYKPGVTDMRESPGITLIEMLRARGAQVNYNDPHIPSIPPLRNHDLRMDSAPLTAEALPGYDAVLLITAHAEYDYPLIAQHAQLIIDTRNAFKNCPNRFGHKIFKA